MAIEAAGLVLGEDQDLAQAAVEAVGQGEIDDAIEAAEGDGGLGAVTGERLEPGAFPSGKNQRQHILHVELQRHKWGVYLRWALPRVRRKRRAPAAAKRWTGIEYQECGGISSFEKK